MNTILARNYLERFKRLPEEIQDTVLNGIDRGLSVISTFDVSTGTCACVLTSENPLSLWEEAITKTEQTAMALEIQNLLDSFGLTHQQAIDAALQAGAHVLVAIQHNSPGGAEVYLAKDGERILLGNLQTVEETRH